MLTIVKPAYAAMVAHAIKDAPIEACGYLGHKDGIIVKHFELENMDGSGVHFTFSPQEQFDTMRAMRSLGLRPGAVYHSHPTTPARPSEEDKKLAIDPGISYVIISLLSGPPAVQAFRIEQGEVALEEIRIVPGESEGSRG